MRKLWLTIWYAFEDFLGSGWWLLIILLLTVAAPTALYQMGYRGSGASVSEDCVRYSHFAESC